MVYYFYFLCFGSRRNEVNSLWEKEGGRSQKTTACSKGKMIYCNNIMINLSYTIIAGDITLSALTVSRRQYQNKPRPSVPFPFISQKNYYIHSFWSQNTEKRNNTISQMRLRSVFKMRKSILNTATTEQMGYDIVSFFVCFLSMNQIVISSILV